MAEVLRIALFGLGRMGTHHLNKIRERADLSLVAVADHGSARASEVADLAVCEIVEDPSELVGWADACVVAVPTSHHAAVALPLLERGVACLVEKPIAGTEDEGRALVEAAERGGAVLQVGHVERFNPAVRVLFESLAGASVRRLAARRANPPSDRTFDVDAVLDLMIHDLDALVGLVPDALEPGGVRAVRAEPEASFDRTTAGVEFTSGASATLLVDRRADAMVRDLVVETDRGRWRVDYAARTLTRWSDGADGDGEPVAVPAADPLASQLDAFVRAVRGERAPEVSGAAGLAALALANRVREAAGLVATAP